MILGICPKRNAKVTYKGEWVYFFFSVRGYMWNASCSRISLVLSILAHPNQWSEHSNILLKSNSTSMLWPNYILQVTQASLKRAFEVEKHWWESGSNECLTLSQPTSSLSQIPPLDVAVSKEKAAAKLSWTTYSCGIKFHPQAPVEDLFSPKCAEYKYFKINENKINYLQREA